MVIKNEAYQLPLARNLTGNSGFEYFSLMFMPRPVRVGYPLRGAESVALNGAADLQGTNDGCSG